MVKDWLVRRALAFAFAHYMWDVYAQGSKAPYFPLAWLERFGGVAEPVRLLTMALIFLTAFIPPPLVAAAFMSGEESC